MKYWFRKRKWGWGWTPISTEGWLMTGVFVIFIFMFISVYKAVNLTESIGFKQILFIVGTVILFGYFADKKTKDKVVFK